MSGSKYESKKDVCSGLLPVTMAHPWNHPPRRKKVPWLTVQEEGFSPWSGELLLWTQQLTTPGDHTTKK